MHRQKYRNSHFNILYQKSWKWSHKANKSRDKVVILTTILYISHFYILHFTHYIKKKSCWSLWFAEFCEKYRVAVLMLEMEYSNLVNTMAACLMTILNYILAWYHPYISEHLSIIHWFSQLIGKEQNATCIFNKFLGTHFIDFPWKQSCYYLKMSVIAFLRPVNQWG